MMWHGAIRLPEYSDGGQSNVIEGISLSRVASNCYKTPMSSNLKIGFLGAGKMALALGKGFRNAGLVLAEGLLASDPVEGARETFSRELSARSSASNAEILKFAEVLILAVKPDQVT